MSRSFFFLSFLCAAVTGRFVAAKDNDRDAPGIGRIEVSVQSGRIFVGKVDSRTDIDTLWLRYGTSNMTLLRPIQWKYVLAAQRGATHLTKKEVIKLARQTARTDLEYTWPNDRVELASGSEPNTRRLSDVPGRHRFARRTSRVRRVEVDASLGNWDGDVEPDGLVVAVALLDELGESLQVDGVLHVTLTASKRENYNSVSDGERIGSIGQWTVALNINRLHRDTYVVRLPFQAIDPGFNTAVAGHGLVHIRLVLPGHGTFDRSIDGLRVRNFAPLRDQLERSGQSRWLSHERTGRN